MLKKANENLNQIEKSSKIDSLSATRIFLTVEKFFTAEKNTKARELVRQREALIKAGVVGTSLDLRDIKGITVDTTKQVRPSFTEPVNYQGQAEFNPQVKSESSNPKTNEYNYTPIESVLYDSNVDEPITAKEETLVDTGKKVGLGVGVAVAGGIIIYLMGKSKIL